MMTLDPKQSHLCHQCMVDSQQVAYFKKYGGVSLPPSCKTEHRVLCTCAKDRAHPASGLCDTCYFDLTSFANTETRKELHETHALWLKEETKRRRENGFFLAVRHFGPPTFIEAKEAFFKSNRRHMVRVYGYPIPQEIIDRTWKMYLLLLIEGGEIGEETYKQWGKISVLDYVNRKQSPKEKTL